MTRIGVIGAGITGVTTAYALNEHGYDVTVFDQHRYAAMETSFANGGQLSASNAEVWNKTSTVWHGLYWMLRRDAPLLMNPMPSWHKYSWMAPRRGRVGGLRRVGYDRDGATRDRGPSTYVRDGRARKYRL